MEQVFIEFTNEIAANYPALAYLFFFISAVLQILFPPYPGDTVIVMEGYLASKNYFSTASLLLNALTATYLSCIFLYHISLKLGNSIFKINFINKYFPENKALKLNGWFSKFGASTILISKFVPGIGSLAIIASGIFKVPRIKAYTAMGIAVILHNSMLFFAGKIAGDNMDAVKILFNKYKMAVLAFFFVCIICYFAFKYYQARHSRSKN